MRFVDKVAHYGLVIFDTVSEPTVAQDGSRRVFVWAEPVGRCSNGKGRPLNKPIKIPRRRQVFFLPLPTKYKLEELEIVL